MPRRSKTEEQKSEVEETVEDTKEAPEEKKEGKATPKKKTPKKKTQKRAVALPPRKKKISFDVWATRRDVKLHHRRGMKAFVSNPNLPRTLEEWDSLFIDY